MIDRDLVRRIEVTIDKATIYLYSVSCSVS